jgi:hypothetical protein
VLGALDTAPMRRRRYRLGAPQTSGIDLLHSCGTAA